MSDQRPEDDAAPAAPDPVAPPPALYVPGPIPPQVRPASAPAVPPVRRPRGGRIAIGILATLLVAACALAGYLWYAVDAWRADSDAWQAQARAHGADVAELQARLDETTQVLESTRDQLTSATARITELADEKARLGDENAVSGQYLDYQRRVSEAAGVVARALDRCTQGQAQLITYLRAPDQYDPADVERFTGEVEALCQQASDANTQLQTELGQ